MSAVWGATSPQYPTTQQYQSNPQGTFVPTMDGGGSYYNPQWDFTNQTNAFAQQNTMNTGVASAPGPSGWTAAPGVGAPAYTAPDAGGATFGGSAPGVTYGATMPPAPQAPMPQLTPKTRGDALAMGGATMPEMMGGGALNGYGAGGGMAYAGGGTGNFDFRTGAMTGGQTGQPGGYTSSNPYQGAMADDIGRRTGDMLDQRLSQIRGTNLVNGTLGSDRYKLAQGQAIGDAGDALSGNLAGLYGGLYTGDQNRSLSRYGMDQGFYSSQRGQDLQQLGLGSQLLQQGQQLPWLPIQNANQTYGNYTGYGQSSQQPDDSSNWQEYLGLGLGGLNLWNNWGK